MRTKLWVGLDVGADLTSACVIDARGSVLFEQEVATNAVALHSQLKIFKRQIELIGLESGAYGTHLTRALRRLGYRVAVFDSRRVSRFLAIRQNKTDKNDAHGLAEAARWGGQALNEVHIKSPECQRLRSILVTRQRIVRVRVAIESIIRAQFRLNGGRLKSSKSAVALRRNVIEALKDLRRKEKIDLRAEIEPLLTLAAAMRTYLEQLEGQLRTAAHENPVCKRFLEIPGIGPICALSFYTAIENPIRFRRSADVGAYLGMVPKVRQSGQHTKPARITKAGSSMTRAHLTTAALQHLRYGDTSVQLWGAGLAARVGNPKARMAVARKLAVLMLSIWKSGERYDPNKGRELLVSAIS